MREIKTAITILCVLMIVMLSITGCGKTGNDAADIYNDAADIYIEMAQDYIDEGDYDSAVDVLEKGLSSTGSAEIEEMLKEVIALQLGTSDESNNTSQNESSPAFNNDVYDGIWAEEEISWVYGGMIIQTVVLDDTLEVHCSMTQSAPASRIAEFIETVSLSDITKNDSGYDSLTFDFSDDGWGHSGTVELTWIDENLEISIMDVKHDGEQVEQWGFWETDILLQSNPLAHDAMTYTMDEYYAMFPEEDPDYYEPQLPTESWIEKGGIRYDDISATLAIHMSKVLQDIESNDVFDKKYQLVELLPITGEYTDYKNGADEYQIVLHAYVSDGSNVYKKIFKMTYNYNDIGGWQYKSNSFYISSEDLPVDVELFSVLGTKLSEFGYDAYPQGCPLSLGEIADDILYGQHNIIEVYNQRQVFDIEAIEVVKGNYWSNEYASYLTLTVNARLSNSLYDSEVVYELDYQNFAAGGWELSRDGNMIKSKTHSPKQVTYSDANFLSVASKYFHEISPISSMESTNSNGELVKEIQYSGKRIYNYLTEEYTITLVATFSNNNWRENVNIELDTVDYSKLIGVWNGECNGETFRLTVINMTLDESQSSGTISYIFETSLASSSNSRAETEKLNFGSAHFSYQQKNYDMKCHQAEIVSFTSTANKEFKASLNVHRDSGIIIDYATIISDTGGMDFNRGNDVILNKAS